MPKNWNKKKVDVRKRKALKKTARKKRETELLEKFIEERVIMAGKEGYFETNYENVSYEINVIKYSLNSIKYELNGIRKILSEVTQLELKKLIEMNITRTHNMPVAASAC